ncbi:O-antigen ligase family protein [Vibrio maerlii]|uniref:O-antigen ligase family protein n=1 Tax=Vibrio maerlii TaxID=2231648 RepID=UPI003B8465ED
MSSPIQQSMTATHRMNRSSLFIIVAVCFLVFVGWYFVPHPVVGLAIALLPIAIIATIRMLFWLILLFVVFSFFRIHEVIPQLMPFKLPLLFSLGALASICWHLMISRTLKLVWHPAMKWLLLFWLVVILSVVFASNRGVAIHSFKGIYWKIMIMTLAIIWVVNRKEYLAKTCWTIVLAGALVSIVALYNSAMGIGLVEGSRVTIGRAIGSMLGDPNDLALVLLFPMGFSISLLFSSNLHGVKRLFAGLISFMLIAAIIATQSRGGLLGMVAVCGYFLSQVVRSKSLLALAGAIGLLVLYIAAGISDRASGGAAEAGIDASAMGRLYAWEAAFKMALDNPLFGVGLNNFYFNYFFYSPHWDGLNHAVHSTWFGVLAETGFLGLMLFLALIVSLLRTAQRSIKVLTQTDIHPTIKSTSPNNSKKSAPYETHGYLLSMAKAVLAGLLGTVVSGTFLTQGFVWPIYILAALIICVAKITQNDSQNEK